MLPCELSSQLPHKAKCALWLTLSSVLTKLTLFHLHLWHDKIWFKDQRFSWDHNGSVMFKEISGKRDHLGLWIKGWDFALGSPEVPQWCLMGQWGCYLDPLATHIEWSQGYIPLTNTGTKDLVVLCTGETLSNAVVNLHSLWGGTHRSTF